MRSYSERKVFPAKTLRALKFAQHFVKQVVAFDFEIRCHELARAVHLALAEFGIDSEIIDGHYGAVEHSWLMIGHVILDVYAVGQMPQVQLITAIPGLDLFRLYRVGAQRCDIKWEQVRMLRRFSEETAPMVAVHGGKG